MEMLDRFILAVVLGYLFGSIPFGVIVGKLYKNIDVRDFGSGKMGATNSLRSLGLKMAIIVAALDIAKGASAVLLARYLVGDTVVVTGGFTLHWQVAQIVAALAAIIGHNWPIFLKFRGGRGVAVFFGTWFAISPVAAFFGIEILALVVIITRYVSMGSILAVVGICFLLAPLALLDQLPALYLLYWLLAAMVVVGAHWDNILRLMAGTERRFGEKVENKR